MESLDWHALRSFVVVAEEGHITRAAERLNTQQPPLSLRIAALEKRLGAKLFRRKPRGVELTAADDVLLVHARQLLEQHAKALDAVQRAGRGELGRLCIGTVPTGPMHPLMPSSVRLYRERFPDAAVTLEERLADELMQRLRDEQIGVAFLRSVPPDTSGLVVEVLLTEPMVVAIPRGHAVSKQGADATVAMRDLQNEPFIVFARQQPRLLRQHAGGLPARWFQSTHRARSTSRDDSAGPRGGGLGCVCVCDAGIDAAHRTGRRDLPADRCSRGLVSRARTGLAQERRLGSGGQLLGVGSQVDSSSRLTVQVRCRHPWAVLHFRVLGGTQCGFAMTT